MPSAVGGPLPQFFSAAICSSSQSEDRVSLAPIIHSSASAWSPERTTALIQRWITEKRDSSPVNRSFAASTESLSSAGSATDESADESGELDSKTQVGSMPAGEASESDDDSSESDYNPASSDFSDIERSLSSPGLP